MKTRITLPGTIDNTGDIQPDCLPLPGYPGLDPGVLPLTQHPAPHASAPHSGDLHPGASHSGVPYAWATPARPAAGRLVGDADPSTGVIISARLSDDPSRHVMARRRAGHLFQHGAAKDGRVKPGHECVREDASSAR